MSMIGSFFLEMSASAQGAAAMATMALFTRRPRDRAPSEAPDFSILEHAPGSFIVTDALGVVVEHNDSARALVVSLGTTISAGSKIRSLLGNSADADAAIYRAMRRAAKDGVAFETFPVTASNEAADAHIEISRQHNPRYFLWSITITPKPAETAEPGALPFDMSDAPIAYFSADGEGRIVEMNDAMRRIMGIATDLGDDALPDLFALFGDEGKVLVPSNAGEGDTVEKRLFLICSNGERMSVRIIQKFRTFDHHGGITQSFVVPTRRRPVSDSGDEVRRLVRLLDDAPVAVAVTDLDGLVLEANDRLATMSGGAARVGAEISLAVRLDDRPDVNERLKAVANGAAPDRPLDIKLTGEAGKEHEAHFHANRVDPNTVRCCSPMSWMSAPKRSSSPSWHRPTRCNPWVSSRAASPMTSTTSSPRSGATATS